MVGLTAQTVIIQTPLVFQHFYLLTPPPPWNANVKTNLGKKFLNIIYRCFPNEHLLYKIFNKQMLKLSYSCMPNMKSIISSRNKALLSDCHQHTNTNKWQRMQLQKKRSVSARRKMPHPKCSLPSHSHNTNIRIICGPSPQILKSPTYHTASFQHKSKRNVTELSKHIWTLNDNNKTFTVKWRIIKQCRPYNTISNISYLAYLRNS